MHSDICKSFVDHCLWQVIPDLLQCTFYAALCNRAGHYIYLSIYLSIYLIYLIYLSIYIYLLFLPRLMDVYHTSTYGVALVRI